MDVNSRECATIQTQFHNNTPPATVTQTLTIPTDTPIIITSDQLGTGLPEDIITTSEISTASPLREELAKSDTPSQLNSQTPSNFD